jgi:hypothetical protein
MIIIEAITIPRMLNDIYMKIDLISNITIQKNKKKENHEHRISLRTNIGSNTDFLKNFNYLKF